MQERLIVTFIDRDPGPFADRVREIGEVDGVLDVDTWWTFNGTVLVTVDEEDEEEVIDALEDLPFVARVHYDEIAEQHAVQMQPITVGPRVGAQQTAGLIQYAAYYRPGLRDSIIPPWTTNGFDYAVPVETARKGAGIYVAIIDSGIEPTNSEFEGRTIIALPRRGLNSIGFHGTACAQHVGGNTLGFAPEVTFLDANCFGDSSSTSSSNIVASMGDVADYVAANLTAGELVVANMSYGGSTAGVYDAPLAEMQSLGIVCFASAGNANKDTADDVYPGGLLPYGTVGAADMHLFRSWFSNYGANVFMHSFGTWVPYRGRLDDPADDTVISLISGTSFSTPFTVGCFVLWFSGKKTPQNQADCEFMQRVFLAEMGLPGVLRDRYGRMNSKARLMLADNSPLQTGVLADGAPEPAILYREPGTGIGARQLEVALTYGGTMTDYLLTNNPRVLGAEADTTPGRFPAAFADRSILFRDGRNGGIPLFGLNEVWVSFYLYVPTVNSSITALYQLLNLTAGGKPFFGFRQQATTIEAYRQTRGPNTAASNYTVYDSVVIPQNTLFKVDLFLRKAEAGSSTNSTVQVYFDNALVLDLPDFQRFTSDGTTAAVDDIFGINLTDFPINNANPGIHFSNIRVSDTPTVDKDFLSLTLDTVGTYDEFGLDGFAGLIDPDSVKMARSLVAGQRVSGTGDFASLPDNGAISELKMLTPYSVLGNTADPNALAHFIRVGATNYDQALTSPGAVRDIKSTSLATNPATGLAWTVADLDGMEFGLLSGNV